MMRLRWWVLGYAVASVVATALVVRATRRVDDGMEMWPLALAPIILGIVMLVIQEDSPNRRTAHWLSLPLAPSAVLAAKVVTLVAVPLTFTLIAQAVALWYNSLDAATMAQMLGQNGVAMVETLAIASVLAASSRGAKEFVGSLLLTSCGSSIAANEWANRMPASGATAEMTHGLSIFWCLAAGAVLLDQYIRRDTRRSLWLAGSAAVIAFGIGPFILGALSPRPAFFSRTDAGYPLSDVEAQVSDVASPSTLGLTITMDTNSRDALTMRDIRARVRLSDGSMSTLSSSTAWIPWRPAPMVAGALLRTDGYDSMGRATARQSWSAPISEAHIAEFFAAGAHVTVEGTVQQFQSRTIATLPLQTDTMFEVDHRRFRILRAAIDTGRPAIRVRWISMQAEDPLNNEEVSTAPPPDFVLVDATGRNAYLLRHGGGSAALVQFGFASQTMVREQELIWGPNSRPVYTPPRVDPSVLQGAHLLVIGWFPTTVHRISLETGMH